MSTATSSRSTKPTREEVEALIQRLATSNRHYHGNTHPDLIDAIRMLERLKPATTKARNQ